MVAFSILQDVFNAHYIKRSMQMTYTRNHFFLSGFVAEKIYLKIKLLLIMMLKLNDNLAK